MEYLLDQGARIDAATVFGDTPLILATRRRLAAVAVLLINRGADVTAANTFGDTPVSLGLAGLLQEVFLLFNKQKSASLECLGQRIKELTLNQTTQAY